MKKVEILVFEEWWRRKTSNNNIRDSAYGRVFECEWETVGGCWTASLYVDKMEPTAAK